jgi:magnesium transporter
VDALVQRIRDASSAPRWFAVCEEGRLQGIAPTSELLLATPDTPVGTLARPVRTRVESSFSAERSAWLAAHVDAEVIAVEDAAGVFQGLVPSARLLPILVREHEVDLARVGGFLSGTRQARTASEEPVARRVLHRAPWLLLGLLGAVLSARIVRAFEADLEATVAIAFFLPGIVYMADAVGTQTETLVIRGLSVGVPVRRILRLEVLTGVVVGLLLSLALFPMALLVTGEADLSLAIALSLLASTACASLVAMTLPWLLTQLSVDPAFGSGPLATVIQDLLSILIYFSVAVAVVG